MSTTTGGRHTAPRKARTPLLIVAALVALVVGLSASAASASSFLFPADADNPIATSGCVIRFDTLSSTGNSVVPRIHANEAHYCVGVASVSVDWSAPGSGDLVVTHSESMPVVGFVVAPDETFAKWGITCGASGGIGETRIRCYDRDGTFVPAYSKARLYDPYANLWLLAANWDEPAS